MNLHPKVLFVGDRPNPKKNQSLTTAFVGSVSYKTLLGWLYKLDLDLNLVEVTNAYDVNGNLMTTKYLPQDYKIVALGEEAFSACMKLGYVRVFKLPHPSGLNRSINDKKTLSDKLMKCKKFIYEE